MVCYLNHTGIWRSAGTDVAGCQCPFLPSFSLFISHVALNEIDPFFTVFPTGVFDMFLPDGHNCWCNELGWASNIAVAFCMKLC
jgi:hypothetical protein